MHAKPTSAARQWRQEVYRAGRRRSRGRGTWCPNTAPSWQVTSSGRCRTIPVWWTSAVRR